VPKAIQKQELALATWLGYLPKKGMQQGARS